MTSPQQLSMKPALIRKLAPDFHAKIGTSTPDVITQIAISLSEGIHLIDVADITYLKAEGNYCKISMPVKTHLVSKTLKQVKEKINSDQFLRIHQSYLVNSHCIAFYNKQDSTLQLKNEEILPVSRSGKKVLLQWFDHFIV